MVRENRYTEKELIDGCRVRKRNIQEAMYNAYAKKMFSVCLAYAKDRTAAKDILQEGFLKIFNKIDQYDNSGTLEGWIRKIITNTAIDHFRKHQRENVFVQMENEQKEPPLSNDILDKINADELLFFRLATLHNLTYLTDFMARIRTALAEGNFPKLVHEQAARAMASESPSPSADSMAGVQA